MLEQHVPLPAGTEPPAHTVFTLHDPSPWVVAGCARAVCLQPCPLPVQSLVLMGSPSFLHPKGHANPSWGGFPTNFCATLLPQKGTAPPAGSLWRNKSCCLATSPSAAMPPFCLVHPSACPAPLSELCPCHESQLRTDPSETEGAAPQQDLFSACAFVCKPDWFHDLVYQLVSTAEKKGSLPSWSKPPRPCGGWGGHQHWHWHHHLGWWTATSQPSSAGEKI